LDENGPNEGEEKRFGRPWEVSSEPDNDSSGDDVPEGEPDSGSGAEPEREAEVVQLPGIVVDDGEDDDLFFSKEDDSEAEEFGYVAYDPGVSGSGRGGSVERLPRSGSCRRWPLPSRSGVGPGRFWRRLPGTVSDSEESYEAAEQAASSDLAMRVGSALVVFGLFLGSLLLGGWWFTVFVILLMVVAVGELYATLRTRGYRPLALFGLLGVVFMGVGAHNGGPMPIGGWAAGFAGATVLFFSLAPRRHALSNTAVTIFGMSWVGLLCFRHPHRPGAPTGGSHLLRRLRHRHQRHGGYFVGRSFGRRKLASALAAKTLEGLVGGLTRGWSRLLVLTVFPPWEAIGIERALVAAGLIGVVVPIGDLSSRW
jgi:CDP-diglyceride synthetase